MYTYKIADLIVHMNPLYAKIKRLSQAYKIPWQEKADIHIQCSEEFLQGQKEIHTHLPMEEIENIFTLAYFSKQLLCYSGMVFHASAIAYKGKAYLFSANSGVGKTTHTKLWRKYFGEDNVMVINDDKPVLKLEDDNFFVYGTPWCGSSDENTNVRVPLGAIVLLEQSDTNWIKPADDNKKIIFHMLNQTKHKLSIEELDELLPLIDRLIMNKCFYNMGCTISKEAVELACRTIVEE